MSQVRPEGWSKKDHTLEFRLSKEDKIAIQKAAKIQGVSVSEFIRSALELKVCVFLMSNEF